QLTATCRALWFQLIFIAYKCGLRIRRCHEAKLKISNLFCQSQTPFRLRKRCSKVVQARNNRITEKGVPTPLSLTWEITPSYQNSGMVQVRFSNRLPSEKIGHCIQVTADYCQFWPC
uniref:Large ribosomal subunit protein eL33 n=1 Tax=Sus scrofa TaxID=9823 RepID=A0A8D1K3B9_PIG